MPPAVVDAINSHRAALLAREASAMQAQATAWLQVEQSLQAQLDALAYELANTATPTMGQLVRSRRYRALMEQTRAELAKYADYLEPRIRDGQADMITLALQHSAQAVNNVAAEAGVVVQFDRLPVSAVNDMVGLAGDGSPLRAVLADASRVGPDAMAQELVNGIALGRNPIAVARQAMRLGLGQSFTRMQTISRSEMLRTYRQTTLASYEHSNIIAGYRRISARDSRVCPGCLMADGRFYPVDYGFDQHPNCIVGGTVVNSPQILATSKRWFDGQVIEIRTVNGHVLTVTENHPILTDKGWVAAHLLKVGDNVISSLNSERTISSADPNSDGRPSVIEDVIESFARAGGMAPVSVPTSPIDFHGDGGHGNVDIVHANSLLQDWRQSTVNQPLSKQTFNIGGVGLRSFFAESAFRQICIGALFASESIMGSGSIGGSLFRRPGDLQEAISFGLATDGYTGLEQAITDYGSGCIESLGEDIFGDTRQVQVNQFIDGNLNHFGGTRFPSLLSGEPSAFGKTAHNAAFAQLGTESFLGGMPFLGSVFATVAGDVVTDRILEVSRRDFSGHVYNLQTVTGWYIAEGIVTHNCRCALIPVLKNVPPIQYQDGQSWFAEQPAATQRRILGAGRYDAWQSGRATLDDMVSRDWSDDWGGSLRATRVRDLR